METSVETLDEVSVKLTVEVEPERVKKAFDRAAREIAKQVNLPGFRPGRAPRRILEQRVGEGAIAQAALEDAISEYYTDAVREQQLEPVAQPELDVERFDEAEGCAFTATVEVRPSFEPPDLTGITVNFPDWEVDEDDVDEQLETLRERFAELDVVDRSARTGDRVTLDLEFDVDGELVEDGQVSDAMYEVGSGGVTPELDEQLVGAEAGADLAYEDELPDQYPEFGGRTASFRVHVTDVRAKTLPELDDDFAMTASGFDTLDELREDVRDSLVRMAIQQARHELRGRVVEAYLARADVPLPPRMIDGEVEERLHRLEHQAEQVGMSTEELFADQDTSREAFEERAREQAREAVKARLVLDRLAEQLDVQVEPSDIEQEIVRHAQASGMEPEKVAEIIRDQGTLPVLLGDLMRRKAIDHIVEAAEAENAPPRELLVELGLEAEEVEEEDDGGGAQPSGLIVPGAATDGPGAGGGSRLIVPGR